MSEAFLTVYTASYNRAYILPKLYKSLAAQGRTDFQWLIIDDGSTDGSRELVEGWIHNSPFIVKYFYVEHGGIARAHNRAVKEADTPFLMKVDSDDALLPGVVEVVADSINCLSVDSTACIAFPCKPLKGEAPQFASFGKPVAWAQLGIIGGFERTYVWKTSVLKEHLYPEFRGRLMSHHHIFSSWWVMGINVCR